MNRFKAIFKSGHKKKEQKAAKNQPKLDGASDPQPVGPSASTAVLQQPKLTPVDAPTLPSIDVSEPLVLQDAVSTSEPAEVVTGTAAEKENGEAAVVAPAPAHVEAPVQTPVESTEEPAEDKPAHEHVQEDVVAATVEPRTTPGKKAASIKEPNVQETLSHTSVPDVTKEESVESPDASAGPVEAEPTTPVGPNLSEDVTVQDPAISSESQTSTEGAPAFLSPEQIPAPAIERSASVKDIALPNPHPQVHPAKILSPTIVSVPISSLTFESESESNTSLNRLSPTLPLATVQEDVHASHGDDGASINTAAAAPFEAAEFSVVPEFPEIKRSEDLPVTDSQTSLSREYSLFLYNPHPAPSEDPPSGLPHPPVIPEAASEAEVEATPLNEACEAARTSTPDIPELDEPAQAFSGKEEERPLISIDRGTPNVVDLALARASDTRDEEPSTASGIAASGDHPAPLAVDVSDEHAPKATSEISSGSPTDTLIHVDDSPPPRDQTLEPETPKIIPAELDDAHALGKAVAFERCVRTPSAQVPGDHTMKETPALMDDTKEARTVDSVPEQQSFFEPQNVMTHTVAPTPLFDTTTTPAEPHVPSGFQESAPALDSNEPNAFVKSTDVDDSEQEATHGTALNVVPTSSSEIPHTEVVYNEPSSTEPALSEAVTTTDIVPSPSVEEVAAPSPVSPHTYTSFNNYSPEIIGRFFTAIATTPLIKDRDTRVLTMLAFRDTCKQCAAAYANSSHSKLNIGDIYLDPFRPQKVWIRHASVVLGEHGNKIRWTPEPAVGALLQTMVILNSSTAKVLAFEEYLKPPSIDAKSWGKPPNDLSGYRNVVQVGCVLSGGESFKDAENGTGVTETWHKVNGELGFTVDQIRAIVVGRFRPRLSMGGGADAHLRPSRHWRRAPGPLAIRLEYHSGILIPTPDVMKLA